MPIHIMLNCQFCSFANNPFDILFDRTKASDLNAAKTV
jgi:hypothetical protein